MLFSSIPFIYIFLPLLLILYYVINNAVWRRYILIAFSLVFYAWGEPVYVLLMIFSTLINYLEGRLIASSKEKGHSGKGLLAAAAAVNIGLLVFFKYTASVITYVNLIPGITLPVPEIIMPIGISFYTFQALSYVIDVYRGDVPVQKNYSYVLLYVSLFPQLVAGPIVRYSEIEHSIRRLNPHLHGIVDGACRFCFGLGKKVLIANACGEAADGLLGLKGADISTLGSWAGVLFFALQIYFDFSGYSDMAIGLGRMFGFHFNENFDYPYISKSATEFWRRWHISLGSFFRDYLYIPLGGNRSHWLRNIAVVWLLTGLWHGDTLNFVLWGGMYGVLLVLEKKLLLPLFAKMNKIAASVVQYIYMAVVTLTGWAIFYFTDFSSLKTVLAAMYFSCGKLTDIFAESIIKENIVLLVPAILLAMPIIPAIRKFFARRMGEKSFLHLSTVVKTVFAVILLLLSTVMLTGNSFNPFLYFKF